MAENTQQQQNVCINGNSTICDLCQVTIEIIKSEISLGNATIHYIEDVVQIICDIFNEKQQCATIITDINDVIDMIEKGWTADDICKNLHLCNATIHR